MENNGKAIERAVLILAFLIQLVALGVSYGKLSGKVDGLADRLGTLEQRIDNYFDPAPPPRRVK